MTTTQVEVPDGKTMLPAMFVPNDKVNLVRDAFASMIDEEEGTVQERAELSMKITLRRPVNRYRKKLAEEQADTSNLIE